MSNEIQWKHDKPGADERSIASLEQRLGVRFPESYRSLVSERQGGSPRDACFAFTHPRLGAVETCVGRMLTIDEEAGYSISRALANLDVDRQLPDGLIPFASEPGGDFVCFDYRSASKTQDPSVVYWSHERDKEDSVSALAPSFDAFLDMLRPDEDDLD